MTALFPCSSNHEKAKFGRCNSGFITEKSGRKNSKWGNFFFSLSSCYNRLGSMKKQLLGNMFWTVSIQFWQCCESTANVHTQVLVWNFADFNIYFFKTAALVWFWPILCYYHNSPGTRWLLKFWTCSLSTLNMSPTEKPCFLETHKKHLKETLLPFLSPAFQRVSLWKQWNPKHACFVFRLLLLVSEGSVSLEKSKVFLLCYLQMEFFCCCSGGLFGFLFVFSMVFCL